MTRFVLANQSVAARRTVYFDLRDATDGIAAETGEAGGQPQISTNNGAFTNTGIGTLTHSGNGRYGAVLTQAAVANAGDVIETRFKSANTAESPGDSVQVVAFDPDDVVRLGITALPAAAAEAAGGLYTRGTGAGQINQPANGRIDTNVVAMAASVLTAAAIATDAITAAKIAANAIGASEFAQGAADKVWATAARILTANTNLNDPTVVAIADAVLDELTAGHTTAGSLSKAIIDTLADTNELQSDDVPGLIAALNDPTTGAIADAVLNELTAEHTTAGSLSKAIIDVLADTNELQSDDVPGLIAALNDPTAAAIADAVLDELVAGHTTPGSLSQAIIDILADTNELQGDDVPGLIAALNDPTVAAIADAVLDELLAGHTTADSLGKAISDVLADTNELQGDDVPGLIAALNDLSTADVNGEMVDVLTVDTIAELAQGVPDAAPTIVKALMLLYMALRNRLNTEAAILEISNSAGVVISKKVLSDDGTTYSEAKMVTGP